MRSVSAHHSDQARDRGPFDKPHSPAADLPQSRGSTRVNERRVPKGPPPAKISRKSLPLPLTAPYQPVLQRKPNPPLYFCVSLIQPPAFQELANAVCQTFPFGALSQATKLSRVSPSAVDGK